MLSLSRIGAAALLVALFGAPAWSQPVRPGPGPPNRCGPHHRTDTRHVPPSPILPRITLSVKITVVAAYKGGSPISRSAPIASRASPSTIQANTCELVDIIDALLAQVDVVLLESVDGRPPWRRSRRC